MEAGQLKMVKLLLKQEADVYIKSDDSNNEVTSLITPVKKNFTDWYDVIHVFCEF